MRKYFLIIFILLTAFDYSFAVTKLRNDASLGTPKTTFEKAVWIPYWQKTAGASSTIPNLDKLTQISPFAYELQNDGTIKNAMKIEDEPWTTLIAETKKKRVKIYPSILFFPHNDLEKQNFHTLMSQKKKRQAHTKEIISLVIKNKFDGIDIDYEAKLAETKPYFSAFLTELSSGLHKNNKKLICTIEARTPSESKYATTTKEILAKVEYVNDYKVIGKVCDEVRIMAYDQIGDDASLNQNNKDNLYRPVSDINWVMKVLTLALWDIPAKKIIVGVPSYGYKYEVIPATTTTTKKYSRIGAMNFNYAEDLAKSVGVTPSRNIAGELSFSYATTTDYSGKSLGGQKEYLVWYSDANAIADKIRIAKLYKLGGVVIFKIDGGQDPNIWEVLKKP